MKIIINSTELAVLNCYAYRYQNGKLVLKIEISQTEIGHDNLKVLLKENTEGITVVRDDGTAETFSGFHYQVRITDMALEDGTEIYACEIENVSENEYQIGILQQTLAVQNTVIADLQEENRLLNDVLLETLV